MINFTDPFGQETILTILPIEFNKTVQLAINSKYKYIAVWDLQTAKAILQQLSTTITILEESDAEKI